MRRIGSTMMIAAAGSLVAGGVFAQVSDPTQRVILSSDEGALLPPEEWNCGNYVEEYEAYLEAGNPPESWRFVGKTYRVAGDDRIYDWREWLQWYDEAGCAFENPAVDPVDTASAASGPGDAAGGGGLFGGNMTAVGIVGGLLLTGAIAAGAGGGGGSERPDSPG